MKAKNIDINSIKKTHQIFMRNSKLILKTQQTFKSERRNVFTEQVNKIDLSSNDDKRMQSFDLTETYAYGRTQDLVSEKIKD